MGFSEREKRLAVVTALLVVIVVGMTGVRALISWAGGSGAHSLALGAEGLGDLISTLEEIDSLRARNEQLKRRLGNGNMVCIDYSKVSELLKNVENTARRSGLKISTLDPTHRPKSKPIPSVEVKVTFECVFKQLVRFLAQLEKPDFAIFVRDLRVSQKNEGQPQLTVQMTLVTYLTS